MAGASHPPASALAPAITLPAASISPIATGTSPAWAGRNHGAWRRRMVRPATPQASAAEGSSMPSVAMARPPAPAIHHPMALATRMFGPGAAWDRA